MQRIPVTIVVEEVVNLSLGGQSVLIKNIIKDLCLRFTPGVKVIYISDADNKFVIRAEEEFKELGLHFDDHGKMPDVVVLYTAKNWLVLIAAVTSHGPVNAKRQQELKELFKDAKAGVI